MCVSFSPIEQYNCQSKKMKYNKTKKYAKKKQQNYHIFKMVYAVIAMNKDVNSSHSFHVGYWLHTHSEYAECNERWLDAMILHLLIRLVVKYHATN